MAGWLNLARFGSGSYGGFDRLGRVKEQKWRDDPGPPNVSDHYGPLGVASACNELRRAKKVNHEL